MICQNAEKGLSAKILQDIKDCTNKKILRAKRVTDKHAKIKTCIGKLNHWFLLTNMLLF